MNGAKLTALRQSRGFLQIELARLSGIDVTVINRMEHSQTRNPTRATYVKLAKAFDMPLAELFIELETDVTPEQAA